MIPFKEDFEYFVVLSQRAIKTSVLAQLVWSAPSPTAAFKMARNSGWSYKVALACRNLAVIRRDWGNDYFKAVVNAGRMYYGLGSDDLCFCTCHQCRKCFSYHNHNANKCNCSCHKCRCCNKKFCFCICHECVDCEVGTNNKVCEHRHHCDNCLTPVEKEEQYEDGYYEEGECEKDYEDGGDGYYEEDYYEDDGYYSDNDEGYCNEEENYEDEEETEEVNIDEGEETSEQIEEVEESTITIKDPLERLQSVVEKIEQVTGKKLEVEYIDSDKFVAQVDRNDKISLSRGLIEATESDDEIAFVISHELSHREEDHIEQINKRTEEILDETIKMADKVKGGVIKRVLGKGLIMVAGTAAAVVISKGRSRQAEKEADAEALNIMIEAGYDPDAAILFLAKYGHDYEGFISELLSTHPTAAERVKNLIEKRKTKGV